MSLQLDNLLGSNRVNVTPAVTDFSDSLQNTPVTINGVATQRRNIWAALIFRTRATLVEISVANNSFATTQAECGIVFRIDGGPLKVLATLSSLGLAKFRLGLDGAFHTIEVWDGFQAWTAGSTVVGSFTYQVSANAPINLQKRLAAQAAVGLYGDSITGGAIASITELLSFGSFTKANFPGRVAVEAWSSRQLFDDLSGGQAGPGSVAAMAARLVGLVAGGTTRTIVDCMGFNDYNNATYTAAAFGTAKGSLWDAIHALDAGITIKPLSLFITNKEAINNANGEKPPAFRTAQATAAAARPSFVVPFIGTDFCVASGLAADGIHFIDQGHLAIYNGTGASAGTKSIKTDVLSF